MKTPLWPSILTVLLCVTFTAQVRAQTTIVTYQGLFTDEGAPFTGSAEFQFTLWNAASGGESVATNHPASVIVSVTNGLFTVALDFGDQVLDGADRFLQIEARTTIGPFTALTPRQRITAVPYAVRARSVSGGGLSGGTYANAVTFNNPANSFTGNGAGLTSLDASQLSSGTVPAAALENAWKTGGNAGTTPGTHFLGTTDTQPLEFKVNGLRALRLEDNGGDGAPNVIAGSSVNLVGPGVVGATIGGGGATDYQGAGLTRPNTIQADFGTIGGGLENRITPAAEFATIAGGYTNSIHGGARYGTIAGGLRNVLGLSATNSAIGGGYGNAIWDIAYSSAIAGGAGNTIGLYASESTIGGGILNTIWDDGRWSTIAGGYTNSIYARAGTVAGGVRNVIGLNAGVSTVGGGVENAIWDDAYYGTIAGGDGNAIGRQATHGTIGGGMQNTIGEGATASVIVAGSSNSIGSVARHNSIGGGSENTNGNNGWGLVIAGGTWNSIGDDVSGSVIGGGAWNSIRPGVSASVIAGGYWNEIGENADGSTVVGGRWNDIGAGVSGAFAAGTAAKAVHNGAFVWADARSAEFRSNYPNKVRFRCTGGFDIVTAVNEFGYETNGVYLPPNGSSWVSISSRDYKKNFHPVDTVEVLEKLAAIPITRWNYNSEADDAVPHLGPMAEDFKGAFYPGRDDKGISTLEFDGVALAAIQGLNRKFEQKLQQKESEITELKQRLEKLEYLLNLKLGGGEP